VFPDHNVRHSRKRLSGHRHNRRNNRRQPSLSNLHRWHRAIRSKNRGKNSRKATGRSFAQARTQCSWCSDGSKISVYNGLSPKIPYNPTRTDEGFSACCPCGDGRLSSVFFSQSCGSSANVFALDDEEFHRSLLMTSGHPPNESLEATMGRSAASRKAKL
jgi:hypothetical protein